MTGARDVPADPVTAAGADVAVQGLEFLDNLYATALRLTRDPSAADDLVQDTYLKAIRFADRFEPGTNLRGWLFTILYNTFRNERRDAGRDPVDVDSVVVDLAADHRASRESPEELLLRDALGAELKAALETLPDVYRQCVWLRDVEEFSYAEIAAVIDVPIGTVMSRISRGRRLLYDRLTSTPGETSGRGERHAGRTSGARSRVRE
jgi:RNA polymerase sigma-70 factor (ECF subfamily)